MKPNSDAPSRGCVSDNGQAADVLDKWKRFVHGQPADSTLRPVIRDSWLRCRGAQINPESAPVRLQRLTGDDLRQRLEVQKEFLDIARPHVDWTSSALRPVPHVVFLTDPDGIALYSVGDQTQVRDYGLAPGHDQSERAVGTNGAGTALATNQPVAVAGPEHYCAALHGRFGVGAPVHDGDAHTIGSVGITTGTADGSPDRLRLVAHIAYAIGREVAARRAERAQAAVAQSLRQSEERLLLMADALPALISYVGADLRYRFNNAAYERWFGIPRQAVAGSPMRDVLGEDAFRALEGRVRAALAGQPQSFEQRVPYRGAGLRDVRVEYVPHRGADGKVAGFHVLILDVTERRQAEAALRESEERLRLAVEVTGMGVWSATMPNPSRYEWSPRLKEIWGLSADTEVTPDLAWSLIQPDDRDMVRRAMEASLNPGGDGRFTVEHRVCRPDGTVVWVQAWGRTVFGGPAGARQPASSIGVILDVTERKRVESALRKSEELTRSILNALTAHIAVLDANGSIVAVNAAWERFARANGDTSLTRSGVGVNYLDACRRAAQVDDKVAAQVLTGLERVLDGSLREFGLEYPCHSPSEKRWFLLQATPLSVDLGGAVVSHTSVTELKRAAESLHESEERFRTFMDNTGAVAWMKDGQGRFVYLNKPFETRFGVRFEDWRGKTDFEVWPRDVAEQFRRNDEDVRRSGQCREVIEHTVSRDGRQRTWLTSKFPFRAGSGQTFVGGIGFDITERLELEREVLEIAAIEQRRIGQELHDSVGQELTGLGLLADALAQRVTADSPAGATLAEKIVYGIGRVRAQVRSLSHGLVPVEVDPEGLRAALEQLAASTRDSCGCACTFEGSGTLGAPDPELATHLFRIAQEAISNALRHSRARHIRIALDDEPDVVTLSVADDGIGFSEPGPGVKGLGLRLMRYRAGVIGGTLTVAPAAGGGTVVTCRIPKGNTHGYQTNGRQSRGGEGPDRR